MEDLVHIAMFTAGYYPVRDDTIKATEYFVYELSDGLKKLGHEISVFASEGTDNSFNVMTPKYNLDLQKDRMDLHQYDQYLAANFCDFMDYCNSNSVDIIHDHTTTLSFALARYSKVPVASTFHGAREHSVLSHYYKNNSYIYNVAPTKFIAHKSPDIAFKTVIHHGVDINKFNYSAKSGEAFLNLGRIVPEKGQLDAIKAARLSGLKLTLAGYVPEYTKDFSYRDEVLGMVKETEEVEFIGKIERENVPEHMANAKALLMPIIWDEAFGLVMIEAMASGTPVIAYNRASAPEIVVDGITGFLVEPDDPKAMADAMKKIDIIDRQTCRKHVEENFSMNVMIGKYLDFYNKLVIGAHG